MRMLLKNNNQNFYIAVMWLINTVNINIAEYYMDFVKDTL